MLRFFTIKNEGNKTVPSYIYLLPKILISKTSRTLLNLNMILMEETKKRTRKYVSSGI